MPRRRPPSIKHRAPAAAPRAGLLPNPYRLRPERIPARETLRRHMAPRPHQRRSSRTIRLPTGKTVEVHYFSSDGPAVRRPAAVPPPAPAVDLGLDHCPECASDVVYPIAWEAAGDRPYEPTLRCPNCEWTEVDTHDWDTVQRLEKRLDQGEPALIPHLQALARATGREDSARFVTPLRAGPRCPRGF